MPPNGPALRRYAARPCGLGKAQGAGGNAATGGHGGPPRQARPSDPPIARRTGAGQRHPPQTKGHHGLAGGLVRFGTPKTPYQNRTGIRF